MDNYITKEIAHRALDRLLSLWTFKRQIQGIRPGDMDIYFNLGDNEAVVRYHQREVSEIVLTTEEGVVSCYYVYREERRADHEEETILDGFLGE